MVEAFTSTLNTLLFMIFRLRRFRFSTKYNFEKPNDRRALELMNAAALEVMREIPDINFAFGISDEFRSILLETVYR